MKKLLLIAVTLFVSFLAGAQFSKASLQATGLTCAMCSNAINKALQKVPFVQSVKSDIKNSSFTIVFKENSTIDIDALKDAVEDAGFSIGALTITGMFNEVKLEKDKHTKIGNENFHFIGIEDKILNGEQTITVVDKAFVTEKQFKKYSAATKLNCMKTGKAASCCEKEGMTSGERVYHVTI